MTRVAVLSADLVANSTRFEGGLSRADRAMAQSRQRWQAAIAQSSRNFSGLETSVGRSTSALMGMQTAIRGVAAAAIGGFGVQSIVRASDAWTGLQNKIALVTDNQRENIEIQNRLFAISQKTYTSVNATATLYQRLTFATRDLGTTQEEVFKFTEQLNKQLLLGGSSSQEAAASIFQLTQAFNKGKLDGDEFRTVLESAPLILESLQRSLGKTKAEILAMSRAGELGPRELVKAVNDMADTTDTRFAGLRKTVEQSLTQLNNAFQRFVGQSSAAQAGTGALAEGIASIADNFDTLAKVATAFAVIMGGKVLISFIRTAAAQAMTTTAAIANAAALQSATVAAAGNARMVAAMGAAHAAAAGQIGASTIVVGTSGTAVLAATTAMGTMRMAAVRLGTALSAVFGGPIGVVAVGAIAAMSLHTNKAIEAQQRYNEVVTDARVAFGTYATASGEARQKMIADSKARIEQMLKEAVALDRLIDSYASINSGNLVERNLGALGMAGAEVFGKLGIGNAPSEILAQRDAITSAIRDINALLNDPTGTSGGRTAGGSGGGSKQKDKIEAIIEALRRETEQLERQNELYGQKASALDIANKRAEIQNQLADANAKLTRTQREEMEGLLQKYDQQTIKLEQQEEATKKAKEAEEERKRVLDSLFSNFESNLEDAIIKGGKLSDVFTGLLEDIMRAIIRAQILEPLISGITSGGTSGGGFWGWIQGMLPSFAVGSYNVPYDMTANIHKGEMIIPAKQAAALRGGGSMGNIVVKLDVHNNNGSAVTTNAKQTPNGISLEVVVDQAVAKNIGNRNSQTAQALAARDQRGLTRR